MPVTTVRPSFSISTCRSIRTTINIRITTRLQNKKTDSSNEQSANLWHRVYVRRLLQYEEKKRGIVEWDWHITSLMSHVLKTNPTILFERATRNIRGRKWIESKYRKRKRHIHTTYDDKNSHSSSERRYIACTTARHEELLEMRECLEIN